MTHEEAKTKWCPFVRHSMSSEDPASNRNGKMDAPTHIMPWNACIADRCMAWRQTFDEDIGRVGFCGLAGSEGVI